MWKPPTWRTRVFLFVRHLLSDLSGLGNPTSGKATTALALMVWNYYFKNKRTIFNTLIKSVLLYGAETWTIKSAIEKKNYQQKWISSEIGQNLKNGKKTNIEIRARMSIKTSIITKIDKKRMQWYGHVQRMDVGRIPQLVLN